MVANRSLNKHFEQDPNLETEFFKPIKHLIIDDYHHFLFVLNVKIPELEINETDGVYYYSKLFLKDMFFLYFEEHASEEEMHRVVVDMTFFNLALRRIDRDLYPRIEFVTSHPKLEEGYIF